MYLHNGHNPKICRFACVANNIVDSNIMSRPFGRSSLIVECHLSEVIYRSHHNGIL